MTSRHSQQSIDNHTSSSRNPIGEDQYEAHIPIDYVPGMLGRRVKYLKHLEGTDWKNTWYTGTLVQWSNRSDHTLAIVKPDEYKDHKGLEFVEPTLMRFEE